MVVHEAISFFKDGWYIASSFWMQNNSNSSSSLNSSIFDVVVAEGAVLSFDIPALFDVAFRIFFLNFNSKATILNQNN
jgi:hypothetical protein